MVELVGRGIAGQVRGEADRGLAPTVVGGVVLVTDPLATTPFGKAWPIGSVHYQIIPRSVLSLIAGITVLTVVITLIVALVRQRNDPGWRRPLLALAAAGVAAVVILGLRLKLPANLAYPALCAVSAVPRLVLAGLTAAKVRLDDLHGEKLRGLRAHRRIGGLGSPSGGGAVGGASSWGPGVRRGLPAADGKWLRPATWLGPAA